MARISDFEILQEINSKGFTAVDITQYKNLKSPLIVKCNQEHLMETNLETIRKSTFRCPTCHGGEVTITNAPPAKSGYRILALDNASQNMGLSIFDDGKLVYYSLLKFRDGLFEDRLQKIFEVVENIMIKNWQPDFIVFEDIQYQNNYNTYKKLAMLLGTIILAAKRGGVKHHEVQPVTWRSHMQVKGTREVAKQMAIELVNKMYGITVVDDIAEAILIGRYAADMLINKMEVKMGF